MVTPTAIPVDESPLLSPPVTSLVEITTLGAVVGDSDGNEVSEAVGNAVGDAVGWSVGEVVGETDGEVVGEDVGAAVGGIVQNGSQLMLRRRRPPQSGMQ